MIFSQVLFGEQLKLRDAVTGITQSILEDRAVSVNVFGMHEPVQSEESQQVMVQTTNQMEIQALQQELSTMRIKYAELERNHVVMMELMEKLLAKSRRTPAASWSPWRKPSKGDRGHDSPSKAADIQSSSSTPGRSRPSNAQSSVERWRNSIS
jgi:TolA-binding protein